MFSLNSQAGTPVKSLWFVSSMIFIGDVMWHGSSWNTFAWSIFISCGSIDEVFLGIIGIIRGSVKKPL